jgi:hypothetical protein
VASIILAKMANLPKTMKAAVLGKAEGEKLLLLKQSPECPLLTLTLSTSFSTGFSWGSSPVTELECFLAGKPGQVWHPVSIDEVDVPQPKEGQVLVKLNAAALNHREVFVRQCECMSSKMCPRQGLTPSHPALYPGIQFGTLFFYVTSLPPFLHLTLLAFPAGAILGADGAGVVVSPPSHALHNKAVLLSPEVGWHSSTHGPDQQYEFGILGGTKQTGGRGTFAEYIAIDEKDLVECPSFLLEEKDGWALAAALAALTAYRWVSTYLPQDSCLPRWSLMLISA